MFANARTPGRRNVPVSDDRDAMGRGDGPRPAGFRSGGLFEPAVWSRDMFRYGGIPGKPPTRPTRYDDGDIVDGGDSSGSSDGLGTANADYEEVEKAVSGADQEAGGHSAGGGKRHGE